ncbi:MAG: hypothetical protein E7106_08960 [Prevotella sp.]|nr:hypothetical protein [Clostridium lundense]MBE6249364.1 hypothetical protein [Prevotella sp.]
MKRLRIWSMLMLLILALPMMVACGGDDGDDVKTINKSDLIGTWYTLEDDWVIVIGNSSVTQYEIWSSGGTYSLNSYTYTWNYTINGNRMISDDGQEATISINGNMMIVSANGQTMNYTKYNGTPQQLIVYLNGK